MQTRMSAEDYILSLHSISMRHSPINRLALTRIFKEKDESLDEIAAYYSGSLSESCENENAPIRYYCNNLRLGLQSKSEQSYILYK